MKHRRFLGTYCGIAAGLIAIIIWLITFEPHSGSGNSISLFPLAARLLNATFPNQSIPLIIWFISGFLLWVLIGVVIDLYRFLLWKNNRLTE